MQLHVYASSLPSSSLFSLPFALVLCSHGGEANRFRPITRLSVRTGTRPSYPMPSHRRCLGTRNRYAHTVNHKRQKHAWEHTCSQQRHSGGNTRPLSRGKNPPKSVFVQYAA
ncbi:hypothetical protein ACQKWADRAFT_294706 [Trichoderma austrokoningii]